MKKEYIFVSIWLAMFFCTIAVSSRLCAQADKEQPLRVTLIGFADRWADYGSRGNTPGFRDFLAILHRKSRREHDSFIKVRYLYWREGKSDPKVLSKGKQKNQVLRAKRDSSCDETFAALSHEGEISYLDPQLKPSQFVHMKGSVSKLPPPEMILPCYEVK